MNLFELHRQVLNGLYENVVEEEVKVNQRHLIDKILARYSGEYTVFRELLQNSNDAKAKIATIKFYSENSLVTRIEYMNDGAAFSEADWDRLRKISEGNPDETKIGFFGVGFYSLFSLCEEPFVSSGKKFMGFFWKGDQLFTRVGDLPHATELAENGNRMTIFTLVLREPMSFPDTKDFTKFLCRSMMFTTNLIGTEIFFDESKVITLKKAVAPSLPMANSHMASENNFFKASEILYHPIQLSVSYFPVRRSLKSSILSTFWGTKIDSSVLDFESEIKLVKFYRLCSCRLATKVSKDFVTKYYRMTKKQPPNFPAVNFLYSTYSESIASSDEDNVLSDYNPRFGKIFIGFPTFQTTGCKVHLYSQFIPTVEREQIDFVDSHLRMWNLELLSIAGKIFRCAYESELQKLSLLYSNSVLQFPTAAQSNSEKYLEFVNQFTHLLDQFDIETSTPSDTVSNCLDYNFLGDILEFPVLTTVGKSQIRDCVFVVNGIPGIFKSDPLDSFISCVPIFFPKSTLKLTNFCAKLKIYNCVMHFSATHVMEQLKSTIFNPEEDLNIWNHFYTWLLNNLDIPEYPLIISNIKFVFRGQQVSCSQFTHYHLASEIFPDFSVPNYCFPCELSRALGIKDLSLPFKHLVKLSMVDFLEFIFQQELQTEDFNRLLLNYNNMLFSFTSAEKTKLRNIFHTHKCIPTELGILFPSEVFVSKIIFKDLPRPEAKLSQEFEKFLQFQSVVDLQLLFDRLESLNWNFKDLIIYLSNQDLSAGDFAKLRSAKIFPCNNSFYIASDLYAQLPQFSDLNLKKLDYKWHLSKKECQLMIKLGVKIEIPFEIILDNIYDDKFFNYLLDRIKNYRDHLNVPFIPALNKDGVRLLGSYDNTFSTKETLCLPGALYFKDHRLLLSSPSSSFVYESLKLYTTDPLNWDIIQIMEYCSQISLHYKDIARINSLNFVPYKNNMFKPSEVYLNNAQEFEDFFRFVNFTPTANQFLINLNVRQIPDPQEVVDLLPIADFSYYQKLLLYLSKQNLSSTLRKKLGQKIIGISNNQIILGTVDSIFLNDDQYLVSLFEPILCPSEQLLDLYQLLGVRWISEAVSKTFEIRGIPKVSADSENVSNEIKFRIPLFLYDQKRQLDLSINDTSRSALENLIVREVSEIEVCYNFNGNLKKEFTSALYNEKLFLSTKCLDMYHIAIEISRIIYHAPKIHQHLLVHTLLTIPLSDLKRRGYPVEKLYPKQFEKPNIFDNQILLPQNESSPSDTVVNLNSKSQTLNEKSDDNVGRKQRTTLDQIRSLLPSFESSFEKSTVKNMNTKMHKALEANLKSSIQNARKEASESIEPATFREPIQLDAAKYSCDVYLGENLRKIGSINGISIFGGKTHSITLSEVESKVLEFSSILLIICDIYKLNHQAINIFYEESSEAIAFNRNRALFFNLVVFINIQENEDILKASSYWFMVFAHELAHNHVSAHNSEHEHFMSSYASFYLPEFVAYFAK
eukprot:NODE_165_length_14629_cov_0.605231.p1 type:complete len:1485 gc:universal NODE_165_length_14629_cov_0.605231:5671-1217(-)